MRKNCDCFKFHDVIQTQILDSVFTLVETYYQTAAFLYIDVLFSLRKIVGNSVTDSGYANVMQ